MDIDSLVYKGVNADERLYDVSRQAMKDFARKVIEATVEEVVGHVKEMSDEVVDITNPVDGSAVIRMIVARLEKAGGEMCFDPQANCMHENFGAQCPKCGKSFKK